jgi:teichuronic acid biosynthesis glycosyltransferase TuaH
MNEERGTWDIAIAARDVWGDVRRRRHFLAAEWARDRRVLFIEPPVSVPRWLAGRLDPPQREQKSATHLFEPPRKVADNIFVCTPAKPFPDSLPGMHAVNMKVYAETARSAVYRVGMDRPVLWITPEFGVNLLDRVPHRLAVYDITDDWTSASIPDSQRRQIESEDGELLRRADLVFAVSPRLVEMKKPVRDDVILMPNGVDPDLYNVPDAPLPDELRGAPAPRVGYTGTLHEDRLDLSLIAGIAELARGKYSLVFVGPNYLSVKSTAALRGHNNIFILPAQPYQRLPFFLAHFDVCMIPHALTPFTHSLDPIKAYEYLAAGKPIVATPVDGLRPLERFVKTVSGAREFHDAVMSVISAGANASDAESRSAAARECSWSRRAADIDAIISRKISGKAG